MPSKRTILATLADDELQALAHIFELVDTDAAPRDDALDRLVRSRRAELGSILASMPRSRLAQVCDALGVEVGRTHRAALAERLMGKRQTRSPERQPPTDASTAPPQTQPATGRPEAVSEGETAYVEVGPDGTCRTHTRLRHLTIVRARRQPAAEPA